MKLTGKNVFGLAVLVLSIQIFATAARATLTEGTFKGRNIANGKKEKRSFFEGDSEESEALLFLRPIAGRAGSFFAVLLKPKDQIALYRVDPSQVVDNPTQYVLNPLTVNESGLIGIMNDDPSLTLTQSTDGRMIVNSANSSNQDVFAGYFEFTQQESDQTWIDRDYGYFSDKDGGRNIDISPFDSSEEAVAYYRSASNSGSYKVINQLSGMHLLRVTQMTGAGAFETKIPKMIGIFVKSQGWGTDVRLYLVNPQDSKDLTTLKRK